MRTYVEHSKMAYTVREAAALLSVSRAKLYRMIDSGEVGSVQMGRSRRVTARQIEEFLAGLERRSAPQTI